MTSFCSSRNCHAHNAVSLGQAPLLRQESSASDALLERIAAPPPANHNHAARSRIAKLNCGRVQVTGRLLHKQLVQLVPFLPAGSDVAVEPALGPIVGVVIAGHYDGGTLTER